MAKDKEKKQKDKSETEKHFQETATAEEWKKAFHEFAHRPRIKAPSLSDEDLRRVNIYTREDDML